MIGGQRRPERAAGIAGRRLHPDVLEGAVAQHLAVGHAIECDAAGKTEVLDPVGRGQIARHAQHDLLGDLLHRGREIHLALRERALGVARRAAEQLVELARGHGEAGRVVEVALVEPERAVVLQVDQMLEDQVGVLGLAVGREAHHLVFAGVDLEAGVVGEGGVEQAERCAASGSRARLRGCCRDRWRPRSWPIRRRRPW